MPNETSLLTIAIPTYGRPQELRNCVRLLRNQTSQQFHLLILDNASQVPAASALEGVLDDFPAISTRLIRNVVNIGGSANILRCFELCETEYLWVLGDDDEPLSDAVETVLGEIRDHPGALFYNFACELFERKKESKSHTLDGFIASIDSFPNVLLMSNSVFRQREIVPYLDHGYQFTYAMAPHLVLLMYALADNGGDCLLLQKRIVKWEALPGSIQWSAVAQMLGLGILLDLPLSSGSRTLLCRLVTAPLALEFATVQLLGYKMKSGDASGAIHAMDQIYSRLLINTGRWTVRMRFFFYRYCLFPFPSAGLALFRFIVDRTGKGQAAFYFRDPFH